MTSGAGRAANDDSFDAVDRAVTLRGLVDATPRESLRSHPAGHRDRYFQLSRCRDAWLDRPAGSAEYN
jgi:hypothetical protein